MEHLTSMVSSRGILRSCSVHNRRPVSSSNQIDLDLLESHPAGGSIYICTDALQRFASEFVPKISQPFTLVSGDSDLPVSLGLIQQPELAQLLENPYLVAWHAQNLAAGHPKLHALPIGVDYHTMVTQAGFWSLGTASAPAQERTRIDELCTSTPLGERFVAAYCSWQFVLGSVDRVECMERIDKSLCFFEPTRVPRCATWPRQAQCMFVVSPEGVGMDCHRTWEAILLGCIPIVKRNALSSLFSDLPVIVVDDWAQVSRELLLGYAAQFVARSFDFRLLFREFWMRKIRRETDLEMPRMTFAELRRFLKQSIG